MNNILFIIITIIGVIIIGITALLPIILSIINNDWWFMLMYIAIPFALFAEVFFFGGLLKILTLND